MSNHNRPLKPNEVILRDHSFDGIQEFDQHLPNWWLFTLYGAIVFACVYWFILYQTTTTDPGVASFKAQYAKIEALKLSSGMANLDDKMLWQMSRNPQIVTAGKTTFTANCVACHNADLKGVDSGGIGANLISGKWIHGPAPMDHYRTVQKGVLEKGMPTWGPVLGDRKIAETVAYILSYHKAPEEL